MADRHLMLYTDGGARRNPGPGAVAALALDAEGNELAREAGFIGNTTNMSFLTSMIQAFSPA